MPLQAGVSFSRKVFRGVLKSDFSQYAECVNSGKSTHNEDQAAFNVQLLHHTSKDFPDLPYVYFGIFDGHAGFGASLAASHQFHHILHEKVSHFLIPSL